MPNTQTNTKTETETAQVETSSAPFGGKKVLLIAAVPILMLGLGFASKPLYDTFCRVTGFGGTTQLAENASKVMIGREILVRFDTNTDPDLNWSFRPEQTSMTVKLGQNALAYFTATNTSDEAIVGTASYNVSPYKVAPYFSKLECFCFTEQKLEPGETAHMPVLFFIDPQMADDKRMDEIKSLTLSYTFHKAKKITDDVIDAAQRQKHLNEAIALEKQLEQDTILQNPNTKKGRG